MTTVTIRRAEKRDKDTLVQFNKAMALETEKKSLDINILKSGVSQLLDHPEFGFYCVAETGGVVAGQLMITYEWSDWRNGLFWWIQSVYIHPEYRRMGMYRRLHEFILSESKRNNACGIRLYVDKDNLSAQKTYLACGMTVSHYDLFETDFVLGQ